MIFNKRISLISLFLIMTMLFNVNVVAFEKAPNNTDEAMSSVASHIYNNCVFYNGNILSNKNFSLTDGLTVFYGENIDPSAIIDKYDSAKVIDTESKSTETPISSNNKISNDIVIMDGEVVAVDETDSNTYLMMVYKNNDRVDIKTIEVMYERNVDHTNILSFIESDLTESRKNYYVNDFINDEITLSTSAYNYKGIENRAASGLPEVTFKLSQSYYYIADYQTSDGTKHPLMIYFQNIDYNVYLMATTWDGDQLYTIIVNTTIKPATQIDSSFWNGIENSTYQHVVAIRGAETNYYNLFSNSDTFLSMAPNSNYTNIQDGDTISAVLYCPTAYDFSYNFDVSTNGATKINMTASYSSSETCTIKFMTEKKFSLLGQVPNLSSEDFSYKSGVYMQSGGTILWINVRMGVGYAFVNEDKETKHWVYGTKEIYYESE